MDHEQDNKVLEVDFGQTKIFAKSDLQKLAVQIVREARRHKWQYHELRYLFRVVREKSGISVPRKKVKLLKLPTEDQIRKFFDAVDDPVHKLMLKIALSTGVRNTELTNIKIEDVDLQKQTIFISQGKGAKDRVVIFPDQIKEELTIYLSLKKTNRYVFESIQNRRYTSRRLQQICKHYAIKSGIPIHFHLLRHCYVSRLAEKGLTTDQRMILCGHQDEQSQRVYTTITLQGVREQAMVALNSYSY